MSLPDEPPVFESASGRLAVRSHGAGSAHVVALHGFTLHGGMFAELSALTGIRIAAPDLPGHGGSPPVASFGQAVDLVADWMAGLDHAVPVLGYSQGGRVAIDLALRHRDVVAGLILVSTSTGIRDSGAREQRAAGDDRTAARLIHVGIDRFLDVWLDQDMIGTTRLDPARRSADRALREQNTAEGLAAALRSMGQGVQPYLGDELGSVDVPVLIMAGGDDAAYVAKAVEMGLAIGVDPVIIEGAGHNLILERPDEVGAAITAFLEAAGFDVSR